MISFNRFTLPNGLRVIHHHDPGTAMVAVDVMYNVGSRDEDPGLTGLAHLFEHLMFGGSVNIPDFDGAIERAGGINNAWTSNDFTNFYDVVPAANVETPFWLESDRMLGLAFSEKALEVQRHVVIEEFKQVCLNRPYGDLDHELRRMLYTRHPYGWPVIGKEFSHIERVTLDDEKRFFLSHYAPNNAVLAVCGNVSLERVEELANKWFGPIPARQIAPRTYPQEPAVDEPRHVEMSGAVPQTLVVAAYPMCGYGEPDYLPADIITDVLAAGRASRFYRELVRPGTLFSEADASIMGSEEPGFLKMAGRLLRNGADAEREALDVLARQAARMAEFGVSESELLRAQNRYESSEAFGTIRFLDKAQALAMAEMHGEDINDKVSRYRAVTPDQILATARRIFNPRHRATLIYRPAQ